MHRCLATRSLQLLVAAPAAAAKAPRRHLSSCRAATGHSPWRRRWSGISTLAATVSDSSSGTAGSSDCGSDMTIPEGVAPAPADIKPQLLSVAPM